MPAWPVMHAEVGGKAAEEAKQRGGREAKRGPRARAGTTGHAGPNESRRVHGPKPAKLARPNGNFRFKARIETKHFAQSDRSTLSGERGAPIAGCEVGRLEHPGVELGPILGLVGHPPCR